MSSAHVYLRLNKGQTIDDISEGLLEDCAQLVKANSIQGELFFLSISLLRDIVLGFDGLCCDLQVIRLITSMLFILLGII